MRTKILLLLMAALLVSRRAPAALPADAAQRLAQFLSTDCYTAESGKREQLLAGIPESALWEAYHSGAPLGEIRKVQAHAARAYEERQRFLRTAGTNALPKDEIQRQLAVTKEQYIERRVAQLQQTYRDTAIAGVAIIGTDESVPELQRIARDESNPAQGAAIAALEALNQKYKRAQ